MISEARANLASLLTAAGFRVFDHVPPNITPPCAVILPSSEWVSGGETVREWRIGFDVRIFSQATTNAVSSEYIDNAVDILWDAVADAEGFYLGTVGAPDMYGENSSTFLGVEATIYQLVRI